MSSLVRNKHDSRRRVSIYAATAHSMRATRSRTESGKPSFRRFPMGFALGGLSSRTKRFTTPPSNREHNRGQIGSGIDNTVASKINAFSRREHFQV